MLNSELKVMSGKTVIKGNPSQYVKLNVGGGLFYTTIGTLTKHDTMLRAMFSGRMEVLSDSDGTAQMEEELNNFLHKVNEISGIVQKLASTDKDLQKIGDLEAERYLGTSDSVYENLDDQNVDLHIKNDRTVLNKSAIMKQDDADEATKSQEAFMKEVERDAEARYKDKLIRKERMETFKKRATLAFRRGEYENALTLYNKAIEQIKDSCMLYKNRALTFIHLKMYDKAIEDLSNWALKIEEDDLKAWLLLAKAHYQNGNVKEYENSLKEAKERNAGKEDFIDTYAKCIEK